ncbi:MAG: hypothetical protein ACYC4N_11305 [Pirellulaceae bacterium]
METTTECRSDRGKTNAAYRLLAVGTLNKLWENGDTSCGWIVNPPEIDAGMGTWKPSILCELGRVECANGSEALLDIARKLDPLAKTKDTVARIRAWRLGRKPEGNALALTLHLCKTLDTYNEGHDGMTPAMVVAAIANLHDAFTAAQKDQDADRKSAS